MNPAELATTPYVSVIIPVYNDLDRLRCCLTALEAQTYAPDRYEVIVVDNGSREPVADALGEFPHARCVLEARPGSWPTRNAGIAAAKGEVVAFTDSDCVPRVSWIERGVARLMERDRIGLVAGQIDLMYRDPSAPTSYELYERLSAFRQEENVRLQSFGSTSNLFTHRRVLEHVGPFNADLQSGGDVEWGERVAEAGYELVYAADAVIGHPARGSLTALMARRRRDVGGGMHLRQLQQQSGGPTPRTFWGAKLLQELTTIWKEPTLSGTTQRVRLVGVAMLLRWAVLTETIRLRLGGDSIRG